MTRPCRRLRIVAAIRRGAGALMFMRRARLDLVDERRSRPCGRNSVTAMKSSAEEEQPVLGKRDA